MSICGKTLEVTMETQTQAQEVVSAPSEKPAGVIEIRPLDRIETTGSSATGN